MAGVDIQYKGSSIASIQTTGSKTLKTQGKYCEGDILVDYVSDFSVSNIIQTAVDTDGTPYNGGIGYKTGYRLGSSGAESVFADYCVSGYIPINNGDVIRVLNVGEVTGYSIYMFGYDANFAVYGSGLCALNPVTSGHGNGLLSAKITSSSVKYIRFTFNAANQSVVIVTKNEKISPLEV